MREVSDYLPHNTAVIWVKKKKNSYCSRNGITGWKLKPGEHFLFHYDLTCYCLHVSSCSTETNLSGYESVQFWKNIYLKSYVQQGYLCLQGRTGKLSQTVFSGDIEQSSSQELVRSTLWTHSRHFTHRNLMQSVGWQSCQNRLEGLKRGLRWFSPKTRKYRKEGLITTSRGHGHLHLRCSWLLQEHHAFSCRHCGSEPGPSRSPTLLSEGCRSRMGLTLPQPSDTVAPIDKANKVTAAKRLFWYLR